MHMCEEQSGTPRMRECVMLIFLWARTDLVFPAWEFLCRRFWHWSGEAGEGKWGKAHERVHGVSFHST